MNLHEYQAKALFRDYGIRVPKGGAARSVSEACIWASSINSSTWVVKAQVHAGGRGKAGGVRVAHNEKEIKKIVKDLLGVHLVTEQSGQRGQPVNLVLIESTIEIKRELYLGITIDRSRSQIAIMASTQGGVGIEQIAASQADAISTTIIDPIIGLGSFQCRLIGKKLGLTTRQSESLTDMLMGLMRLFIEKDLSLLEINPLVVTRQGELLAVDAKINVDDNALFRQTDIGGWHDPGQEDEREQIARQHGFNYVALDGDIACMVNGAGLAMATMDIIKLHHGTPANFLDVGGGTTAEKVTEAFKLISADPAVKAILINIFGGIVRCDLIAEGVIKAIKQIDINVPIVVRLEGTNAEQGKQLLTDSDVAVITADDLADAAEKVIAATNKSV